ncbi:hypothetical protein JXA12_04960 [Candidatus Woesearchaeota archaeon]|nr:hypothetical protein [Candidatus Woesearchaeota archaeon]
MEVIVLAADKGKTTGDAVVDDLAGKARRAFELSNEYLALLNLEGLRSLTGRLKEKLPGNNELLRRAVEHERRYLQQLQGRIEGYSLEEQLDYGFVTSVSTPAAVRNAQDNRALYEEFLFRQSYAQKWFSLIDETPFLSRIDIQAVI